MIVILCDSFQDAHDAYDTFVGFLEDNEPWSIRQTFDHSLCVEMEDDLRYIFIDHRMKKAYKNLQPDYINVERFFEGINEFYYHDWVIDYRTL